MRLRNGACMHACPPAAVSDGDVHAVVAMEQKGPEPVSLPFPGNPPGSPLLQANAVPLHPAQC